MYWKGRKHGKTHLDIDIIYTSTLLAISLSNTTTTNTIKNMTAHDGTDV